MRNSSKGLCATTTVKPQRVPNPHACCIIPCAACLLPRPAGPRGGLHGCRRVPGAQEGLSCCWEAWAAGGSQRPCSSSSSSRSGPCCCPSRRRRRRRRKLGGGGLAAAVVAAIPLFVVASLGCLGATVAAGAGAAVLTVMCIHRLSVQGLGMKYVEAAAGTRAQTFQLLRRWICRPLQVVGGRLRVSCACMN